MNPRLPERAQPIHPPTSTPLQQSSAYTSNNQTEHHHRPPPPPTIEPNDDPTPAPSRGRSNQGNRNLCPPYPVPLPRTVPENPKSRRPACPTCIVTLSKTCFFFWFFFCCSRAQARSRRQPRQARPGPGPDPSQVPFFLILFRLPALPACLACLPCLTACPAQPVVPSHPHTGLGSPLPAWYSRTPMYVCTYPCFMYYVW